MAIYKQSSLLIASLVGTLSILACGGCGNGDNARVVGTVTLDGSVFECDDTVSAKAIFQRKEGGPKGIGPIGPDGEFVVKTNGSAKLIPGIYSVSVTARKMMPSQDPNYPPPLKSLLPKKYGSTKTSGLEFEITPGSNRVDLTLSSK